jgi:acyl dehydratase
MQDSQATSESLPSYRVTARNTSAASENKIHDDLVAASYGFRGGLVPGITVYAYVTVPVVERFGLDWLEHGTMQIKFHRPFYDGEQVVVRGRVVNESGLIKASLTAERIDGTVCATAIATIENPSARSPEPQISVYPRTPLPPFESRPRASRDSLTPGASLGTIAEVFDLPDAELLAALDERLPIYTGPRAVAHPFSLLRASNQILMSNFQLGPWIHAASEVMNRGAVRNGDRVSVRGRIVERFERKGHEFVELDVLVVEGQDRIVQRVQHTAIYRPRRTRIE